MDSVTWLVLLRESVDWERYRRPLVGISSNTGLNIKIQMIKKIIKDKMTTTNTQRGDLTHVVTLRCSGQIKYQLI